MRFRILLLVLQAVRHGLVLAQYLKTLQETLKLDGLSVAISATFRKAITAGGTASCCVGGVSICSQCTVHAEKWGHFRSTMALSFLSLASRDVFSPRTHEKGFPVFLHA